MGSRTWGITQQGRAEHPTWGSHPRPPAQPRRRAGPGTLSDYHKDRVWDVKPCLPHPKYFQYQEINKNEHNKGIHKGLQISPLLYLIWSWSVSQLQSSHSIIWSGECYINYSLFPPDELSKAAEASSCSLHLSLIALCCYLLSTLLRSVVKHFCLKMLRERKEINKEMLHQHPGILLLNKNPEGHNKSQSNHSFSMSSSLHLIAVKQTLQSHSLPGVTSSTDTGIQPKNCRKTQIKLSFCQRWSPRRAKGQLWGRACALFELQLRVFLFKATHKIQIIT